MVGLEIPPDVGDPNVKVRAIDKYSLPFVRAIVKRPRLTEAVFGRTRWGNIFTDEMAADPYWAYERIMADGPVAWSPW